MTITPLNGVWWAVLLVLAALAALIWYIRSGGYPAPRGFRNTEKKNRGFLAGLGLCTFCYLTVYKILLSRVPEFDFQAWNELPLQPCNVVALLSIPAALCNARLLKGVCFYGGTVFAALALLMPVEGFSQIPLFSVRGLGFYGFHGLVLLLSVSFGTLRVYRPRYRDIPGVLAVLSVLTALAHGVNLLLRAFAYPDANYFYTCGLPGNTVLEGLRAAIPLDLVYELPLLLPMGLLCLALTLLFQGAQRLCAALTK